MQLSRQCLKRISTVKVSLELKHASFSKTITFTLTLLPEETDSTRHEMPLEKCNPVYHLAMQQAG